MIIVVMGVAGSGKTTVGRALAARLGWPFFDGDDFHPPANITAMSSGVPLSDLEREPWLEALQALVRSFDEERRDAVLACSALRARFRERLSEGVRDLRYVYLRADEALLAQRLATRSGHFMPPGLLRSQLDALDEPEDELAVDASLPLDEIVGRICVALGV